MRRRQEEEEEEEEEEVEQEQEGEDTKLILANPAGFFLLLLLLENLHPPLVHNRTMCVCRISYVHNSRILLSDAWVEFIAG